MPKRNESEKPKTIPSPVLPDTLSPPGGERDRARDAIISAFNPRFIRNSSILVVAAEKQSQTVHHDDDRAAFVTDHADRQGNFPEHRKRHQHNDCAE